MRRLGCERARGALFAALLDLGLPRGAAIGRTGGCRRGIDAIPFASGRVGSGLIQYFCCAHMVGGLTANRRIRNQLIDIAENIDPSARIHPDLTGAHAMAGSQDFAEDPRNASVLLYLNGALVPRAEAKVSVFDAGFVLGDGVWEGFRLHKGRVVFADRHFERLYAGAATIALDIGLSRPELEAELARTLAANGMTDGVHIRLMVTRGLKKTPNQDPRQTISKATIVIAAEWKLPSPEILTR
eukprot:gene24093-25763_t